MEPKKPIPTAPDNTGGHTDAQIGPGADPNMPPEDKPGGMASEGGTSGGGAPPEDREGGMIGEG